MHNCITHALLHVFTDSRYFHINPLSPSRASKGKPRVCYSYRWNDIYCPSSCLTVLYLSFPIIFTPPYIFFYFIFPLLHFSCGSILFSWSHLSFSFLPSLFPLLHLFNIYSFSLMRSLSSSFFIFHLLQVIPLSSTPLVLSLPAPLLSYSFHYFCSGRFHLFSAPLTT